MICAQVDLSKVSGGGLGNNVDRSQNETPIMGRKMSPSKSNKLNISNYS